MSRGFGSDNHAGVHPQIFAALTEFNHGHVPSYGSDEISEKAAAIFRHHFGPQAEVFFLFNGTAANSLACAAMIRSYQSVLVADDCHAYLDECGAPEFFSRGKLIPLPSENGKLSLHTLQDSLIRGGDQHHSQVRAISLTQPTEVGTLYSIAELREISAWAHDHHLYIHMDGARIANAVVALGTTFQEMTKGIDVISFGGTKNGFMFGEALVFLNPELAVDFRYQRKQAGQLPSKTRFISAQFLRYLEGDLWKQIATHQLGLAELLHEKVKNLKGVEVVYPRQSNAVFAKIPKDWLRPLREKFFFYEWDEKTHVCRWMISWDTQREDIENFAKLIAQMT